MFEVGEMLSHYSSSHESTTNYSDSQGLAGRLERMLQLAIYKALKYYESLCIVIFRLISKSSSSVLNHPIDSLSTKVIKFYVISIQVPDDFLANTSSDGWVVLWPGLAIGNVEPNWTVWIKTNEEVNPCRCHLVGHGLGLAYIWLFTAERGSGHAV
ncbi:hypothetical protein V2G26_002168 [Clonostachys chloroleuca]